LGSGSLFYSPATSDLIIRAVISDISIAAVAALLISLIPVRTLQFALGILICILASANVEHILANGANMDVAFSKYLADATFLTGSVMTLDLALLVGLSVAIFCVGAVVLDKMPVAQAPRLLKLKDLTLPVVILSAVSTMLLFFTPVTLVNASWTQANFLEENVTSYIVENFAESASAVDRAEIEDLLYVQDLSGKSILPASRKKNVVLVLVEGISQVHLLEGLMPWLEESRGKRYHLPKYLSNQRQTNRGLYSTLCGRYPNLSSKAAKSDIANSTGTRYPCLPRLLKESGYHTVFMQSAGLGFMRTVVEPASCRSGFDIGERCSEAAADIRNTQLPHAGAVQQQATGFEQMQGSVGRGVSSLGVVFPDASGCLQHRTSQTVDQRRLAHT